METLYFDWSLRRGVIAIDDTEGEPQTFDNLNAMLDSLSQPTRIIGEATFESFNLDRRVAFMERCAADGHVLLTTPNRLTGRARWAMGNGEDKSDENDALAIRYLVRRGVHLKVPSVPDADKVAMRIAANRDLMLLRSTGETVYGPRGGRKFIPAKDLWAESLIRTLPAYESLTSVQKLVLGDGKVYSKSRVAAVGMAARYSETTRDFDFLTGTNAHGYPSQIRADLHHYGWAGGGPRAHINKTTRKRDDLTLTDWRRELRWLYHQLKVSAKAIPYPGL